jgi:superfamily II DNA or RNA helicase
MTIKGVIIPRFLHDAVVTALSADEVLYQFRPVEKITYDFVTELYPEKKAIISAILDEGCATLQLDTGKGKTVIIANIIHRLGCKAIIFAGNKLLQQQLYDDIRQHLNLDEVGRVGGGYNYTGFEGPSVWVVVINSGLKIPKADYEYFDLTVFDECHKFLSPKNFELMRTCSTRWVLALSATVTKKWDWTKIVHHCGAFIDGDAMVKTEIIPGKVRVVRYHGPPEFTQKLVNVNGDMCLAYMSEQFSRDPYRNKMILKLIRELVKDHCIMVIANTNDIITKLCADYGDPESGLLNAVTAKVEKTRILLKSPVIFTNYASCSEGVNIPRITAMIFLTSFVNNGRQISGRALRGKSTKPRLFVDIVDKHLERQVHTRMEIWEERGFDIEYDDYYWEIY